MRQRAFRSASYARRGRRAGARPDGAFGDHPLLAAAAADDAQEPRRERTQRLIEGFGFDRQRMVAIGPPVTVRDRPSRHQVPGGRIMRAKNALISGEASWPSEIVQRHQDGKRIGLVGRCGFRVADQSIKISGPSGMLPLGDCAAVGATRG
jgi:hypothetical protein